MRRSSTCAQIIFYLERGGWNQRLLPEKGNWNVIANTTTDCVLYIAAYQYNACARHSHLFLSLRRALVRCVCVAEKERENMRRRMETSQRQRCKLQTFSCVFSERVKDKLRAGNFIRRWNCIVITATKWIGIRKHYINIMCSCLISQEMRRFYRSDKKILF